MNTLYYGDNLDIMKNHKPDESVDLIYLDPPLTYYKAYDNIALTNNYYVKMGD